MAASVSMTVGLAPGRSAATLCSAPRLNGVGPRRACFSQSLLSAGGRSRVNPFRANAAADSITEISEAVDTLKEVAGGKQLPSGDIVKALNFIEKNKMKFEDDELEKSVGGSASPGKAWRLVFTADKEAYRAVVKGEADKGGIMFPITAVQMFDGEAKTITNGVYLGFIAAVKFSGNFETKRNALNFSFDTMQIKIGPAKFNITLKGQSGAFVFFYADEDIIVARGQSGGTAFWKKPTPTWLAEKGVV